MKRCPNLQVLRRLAEDELDPMETETVSVHLEACADCRSRLDNLSLFDQPPRYPSIKGYQILSELGRGGMGIVYLAQPAGVARPVALKLMRPELYDDARSRQRFAQEIAALTRFNHPGIVRILSNGEHENAPYYTMELISGGSLADFLNGRPQPVPLVLQIILDLARTLVCIHEQGIVHRDLKPGNILLQKGESNEGKGENTNQHASSAFPTGYRLLTTDYFPKISDFGLVKALDLEGKLTSTGNMLGTPDYMSPEQLDGRPGQVGAAADIWALGVILYEMLTGRPPFRGASILETIDQVRVQEPASPHLLAPGTPRALEIVCLTCLQKNPNIRYASAALLVQDLERCQQGLPVQARLPSALARGRRWARRNPGLAASLAGVGLSLIVIAILSLVYGWRADRDRERILRAQEESQQRHAQVLAARHQARQALEQLTAPQITDLLGRQKVDKLAPTQRAWLEDVLKQQRAFAAEAPSDRETAQWAAESAYRVGEIQRFLGRRDEALAAFEQSEIGFRALEDEASSEQTLWGLARAQFNRGNIYSVDLHDDEARPFLESAQTKLAALTADHPDVHAYEMWLFLDRILLATIYHRTGQTQLFDKVLQSSIGMLDSVKLDPALTPDLVRLAAGLTAQIGFLEIKGDIEKALRLAAQARQFWLKLIELEPTTAAYRHGLASLESLTGSAYLLTRQYKQAIGSFQEACKRLAALAAEYPSVPEYISLEAITRHQEAKAAMALKEERTATGAFERAAALYQTLIDRHPKSTVYPNNLWDVQDEAGRWHLLEGRLEPALACLESALFAADKLAAANPTSSDVQTKRGLTHYNLACTHARRLAQFVGPEREPSVDRLRSLEHLQKAKSQKYFDSVTNRKWIGEDKDLDALRNDHAFRAFLDTLEQP